MSGCFFATEVESEKGPAGIEIWNIRHRTHKRYSAEKRTRIVLEGCLEERASPYYAVPTPSRMAYIKLGRRNFLRPAKAFGGRYCPDQALNIGPPALELLLQGATQGRDFTARRYTENTFSEDTINTRQTPRVSQHFSMGFTLVPRAKLCNG